MSRQAGWPLFRPLTPVSVALRVVSGLILLLVAGAAWHEVVASRKALIADTERQMARLDMVFAEQTGRAAEAVDLLVAGAEETLQTQLPRPKQEIDEMLRRRIRGVRQLAAILIVDAGGRPVASTDADRAIAPPDRVAALLARYRADPRAAMLISKPFRVADDRWNALLARPIWAPDGTLSGMAVGSINLAYFEDFYRAVELNENGAIILSLRDGTVLARFPHVDTMIGTDFGNLPPFTDVLAHGMAGTLVMQSPVDGSTRITAIRTLRAFPLAVMVSVEQGRILSDWRREALTLFVGALSLGGAVVVLLLSLSRRSHEVEQLLAQTHAAHDRAEQTKDRLLEQIAERERAEGELRQAQRIEAIGQLTGGVAHDFNNLLTVVLGNVEILQRRAARHDTAGLADRLAAIRAAAERGATLTGHLLAFARRQPLLPKAIDLNTAIHGMRDLLDSAMDLGTQIGLRLADDLWPAMADQSQIELVILNLVLNARDAMPAGGIITIETTNHVLERAKAADGPPAGDYVRVIIKDTGIGIPPDIIGRVFEPFFTTKPLGVGSGLGLSQVFGTARQSGGEVQIDSAIGRGTTVTVDLPRAGAMPSRQPSDPRQESLTGTSATILLVDDDDQVRMVTAAMLQDLGYNVRHVDCGEAALMVMAQDATIDILLTDLVMPGMNGSRLAALARTRLPDLLVVFISGYADQIEGALEPGDRVIRKPFAAADLHRTVEAALNERLRVPSSA